MVRVFDARNRNVANALKHFRKDDGAQVRDKVCLEHRLPVLVVTKIIEKLLHGITKGFVLRVLLELVREKLDLIEQAVGMIPVALT